MFYVQFHSGLYALNFVRLLGASCIGNWKIKYVNNLFDQFEGFPRVLCIINYNYIRSESKYSIIYITLNLKILWHLIKVEWLKNYYNSGKMYDGYSNNQGSTPTTPSTPTNVIRFDKGYIKTLPGILKIIQLLSNLIAFICIKVSLSAWVSAIFYNLLYWLGILITGFLLLCYIFHIVEKYDKIPWLKLEFFYCGAMVIAYIVTSIIATTIGESAGYAVGLFGLVATIAYGADAYLKYKAWKRGLPPQ